MQRSDDGGKTWEPVDNKFVYDGVAGTHQWYDGTPASVGVQAGVASGAVADGPGYGLCGGGGCGDVPDDGRREELARNWRDCGSMDRVRSGSRAREGCACTRIILDPNNPERMFIAISAAGAFRTDDGGKTLEAD